MNVNPSLKLYNYFNYFKVSIAQNQILFTKKFHEKMKFIQLESCSYFHFYINITSSTFYLDAKLVHLTSTMEKLIAIMIQLWDQGGA